MSRSTIQASAVSAIQETTLALANINFDFSLFKVEPPAEYKTIGNALSKHRKAAAEAGSEHVVARKVHALFANILPSTPHLVAAYGVRATEITESKAFSPQSQHENGVFQDWAGGDATTLWAAATSGKGAIAVHLLACMLARLFSPAEATALWEELIASRKKQLTQVVEADPINLALMSAAQVEVTRQQLASWDASARAWLAVADAAKKREQTQTMLVIKNIMLPVNQKATVYSSVTEAWTSALISFDKIISGVPCNVTNGAILLALGSWHIYPDMHLLGTDFGLVKQFDRLVSAGGMVTLGASSCSPAVDLGVHWSLPLSCLRFYGEPVKVSRHLDCGSTRLEFSEVFHVVLGSIFNCWGKHGDDFQKACHFVSDLSEYLFSRVAPRDEACTHWLKYLGEAADQYCTSQKLQRDQLESLVARGRRRYSQLLADRSDHPTPMFGMLRMESLLNLMRDQETRIACLRYLAKRFNARSEWLLIRYKKELFLDKVYPSKEQEPQELDGKNFIGRYCLDNPQQGLIAWEYATALPQTQAQKQVNGKAKKKRKTSQDKSLEGFVRWTQRDKEELKYNSPTTRQGEKFVHVNGQWVCNDARSFRWNFAGKSPFTAKPVKPTFMPPNPNSDLDDLAWDETCSEFVGVDTDKSEEVKYELLLGDGKSIGLYHRADVNLYHSNETDIELLRYALEQEWIDPTLLVKHLNSPPGSLSNAQGTRRCMKTLEGLAAAADVYKLMPAANVSPGIFTGVLQSATWISNNHVPVDRVEKRKQIPFTLREEIPVGGNLMASELRTFKLSRPETFACIAMFEHGSVNLDPKELSNVMAISAGNSIYVAMPLVCDPAEVPADNEVKHIVGNVGKPGISILIPPASPKVHSIDDDDDWRQVNHSRFDGRWEDSFQKTSLHLSFTGYELPLSVESHGNKQVEAQFVETLVSIFDRTEWVADIDVLGALEGRKGSTLNILDTAVECTHNKPKSVSPPFVLTSIDSWYEFLDRPKDAAIFRTARNKHARLAAAALSLQESCPTVLIRGDGESSCCWACVERYALMREVGLDVALTAHDEGKVPIFIA
jgi:hypothetical protein